MFKKLFILSVLTMLSVFSYAENNSFTGTYKSTQGVFNFDTTNTATTTGTNVIPNDLKKFEFTVQTGKNETVDYFILSFYSQFGQLPDIKGVLRPQMVFLENTRKFNDELQVNSINLPDNMNISLKGHKLLVSVAPREFQVKYFRGNPPVNFLKFEQRKFTIKVVLKKLPAPKVPDIIG